MDAVLYILSQFDRLTAPQLRGAFIGVMLDDVYDTVSGVWSIHVERNDGNNEGIVIVESANQKFTARFKQNERYPEVTENGGYTKVNAPIINGRIQGSSINPDTEYVDTLPDPRIDITGLSESEIDALRASIEDLGIMYEEDTRYIELLMKDSNYDPNVSFLNNYASRIYYPVANSDTPPRIRPSSLVHQTKQDRKVNTEIPIGSEKAAEIMSHTPVYINKTLKESLPVIDPASADTTNEVLNSMDKRTFNDIRSLYNEGLQEIMDNKEFTSALRRNDYNGMKKALGLKKGDKLSESLRILFGKGATLTNLRMILAVDDDPILTNYGEINVFTDNSIKDLSEALTVADEYIRYNDIYDARYNVFTSRGERMYVEGDNNYQSNTVLRENLRFAPADASKIDKRDYTTDVMEALGGALVEDGIVDGGKTKYTSGELVDIATKYYIDDDFSKANPRVWNYLNALHNVDEYNVVDTGASVTIDATFSGLAVNSAITGKTDHLNQINIDVGEHTEKNELRDLYSEVGKPVIDNLVDHGFDRNEARKISKLAIMSAMYNSSDFSRYTNTMNEIRNQVSAKWGKKEADEVVKSVSQSVMDTAREANKVLGSTIDESEILKLCDKGIIKVYERGESGTPVEFIPKTEDDLLKVAGIQILKPDGTASVLTNSQDRVYSEKGKVFVSKNDHVIPYTETERATEDGFETRTNRKKLLDNVSTAIARTYDSYVASYVVEKLHDEGIPVVTTHDAFTVPVYAKERTRDLYNEAINNIYKFGGSDIVVDARDNLSVE